jgi:hypothetical protein
MDIKTTTNDAPRGHCGPQQLTQQEKTPPLHSALCLCSSSCRSSQASKIEHVANHVQQYDTHAVQAPTLGVQQSADALARLIHIMLLASFKFLY